MNNFQNILEAMDGGTLDERVPFSKEQRRIERDARPARTHSRKIGQGPQGKKSSGYSAEYHQKHKDQMAAGREDKRRERFGDKHTEVKKMQDRTAAKMRKTTATHNRAFGN